MLNLTNLCRVAGCFLFVSASVFADDRDLIRTLYHAEFSSYTEDEVPRFKLDGELGMLINTGNTSAASVKTSIRADHETHNWSSNYLAEMLYKESASDGEKRDVSAQRFYASGQFDYKLHQPGRRLFMFGDYEDDRFNGYDYRASLAAGWSQRLWRDEESEFRYSIGPGYAFVELEDEVDDSINNGVIVRASAEYKYHWNSGANLRQFISTEAGGDNTKSRSETSLSANIFGSLAMKLSFVLNHESDTAEDVDPLSTETSVALVYQFF